LSIGTDCRDGSVKYITSLAHPFFEKTKVNLLRADETSVGAGAWTSPRGQRARDTMRLLHFCDQGRRGRRLGMRERRGSTLEGFCRREQTRHVTSWLDAAGLPSCSVEPLWRGRQLGYTPFDEWRFGHAVWGMCLRGWPNRRGRFRRRKSHLSGSNSADGEMGN